MSAKGDYYPFGPNMYVPNCVYAADTQIEGKPWVDLGVHDAPSATVILNAQSIAAAGNTSVFAAGWSNSQNAMGKFGRALQVVAAAAATSSVTITGFDYLGQPMIEVLTLNGTTPVVGKKAFRRVTNIAYGATATTINVGTADVLGLPYATVGDVVGYTDSLRDATQGTTAVYVASQSTTSGDPRGTWAPHSSVVSNGVRRHTLTYEPLRGNLYGPRHVVA